MSETRPRRVRVTPRPSVNFTAHGCGINHASASGRATLARMRALAPELLRDLDAHNTGFVDLTFRAGESRSFDREVWDQLVANLTELRAQLRNLYVVDEPEAP